MTIGHWLFSLLIAAIALFSVGMMAHDYERHVEKMTYISCKTTSGGGA